MDLNYAAYGKIGELTKNDIIELRPSLGKTSVENSLMKLAEDGIIVRRGKGRSAFYTRSGAEQLNHITNAR